MRRFALVAAAVITLSSPASAQFVRGGFRDANAPIIDRRAPLGRYAGLPGQYRPGFTPGLGYYVVPGKLYFPPSPGFPLGSVYTIPGGYTPYGLYNPYEGK